jgi:putative membrane protein
MRLLGQLLVSWLCNAIVLAILAWIFTDIHGGTTGQLLAAAAIFGVLNTILKPIMRLLTFPLAIITLGIAWFFVSMLMLWLTDIIVPGFDIHGFWTYVWATIVAGIVNFILDLIFAGMRRGTSGSAVAA